MKSQYLDSCIIGTGFSGLVMAIKLKQQGINNFIILEKADAVGGTWRENTYPGAECDIPSALYSYSFELNPHWQYKWSMQPQILDYIEQIVDKYQLRPHIHFNQNVASAYWNNSQGCWHISSLQFNNQQQKYTAKTLVSAVGQLHYPATPSFKGMDSFMGNSWHSAQWNHNISLTEKRIAVIGNAASAVQFIPEIAKVAKQVTIYQRSANWIIPKLDRVYKDWEKKLAIRFPFILKIYRLQLWLKGGVLFLVMKDGNQWLRNIFTNLTKRFIKQHISDTDLITKLIPDYPLGAKRVLMSDTYYPALARDNVSVITENITSITETGIVTDDNQQQDYDVIIYATGFKTNPFLQQLNIKGENGKSLAEHWQQGEVNYLGISVDQFPNLFLMYGPNTNLGHNSILLMSEAQAKYITQCIDKLINEQWTSIDVKTEVINHYHQTTQQRLNKMIWAAVDKSWYKSANGNISNNFPGRTMEYQRITKKVNFNAYNIQT